MSSNEKKCVILLDASLPSGVTANTAAILGMSLGKEWPEAVGPSVTDRSGCRHAGIVQIPIPVLKATPEQIQDILCKLNQPEFQDMEAVDFSDLAQGCKTYDEFIEKMAKAESESLHYLGLALCGNKKQVSRLTGSLPLLR